MTRLTKSALLLLLCVISPAGITKDDDSATLDSNTFAIINGEQISTASFLSTLNSGMRQRFYHGNIPATQLAEFRKEVATTMVNNLLLIQEAKKRNITPDSKHIEQQLANYEKRYAERAEWQARREKLLPQLRSELENRSIQQRINEALKKVAEPNEAAVRKYYEENPDKFTTPQRNKVSLILLKVDPSSPASVWDNAREEAEQLIARIKGGESFAKLAKIHSADTESAAAGGDMGYLHAGMLAEEAEAELKTLKEGEISKVITTLQGAVIIKLEEVIPATLNEFATVSERASALLQREMSDTQYKSAIFKLREQASIQLNKSLIE